MRERPIIGLTLGDPAGIGPEIVVKALMDRDLYSFSRPFIVGDARTVEAARRLVPGAPAVQVIESVEQASFSGDTLEVLEAAGALQEDIRYGAIQSAAGRAAYDWFLAAIQLANSGVIDGIATAPVNKEAFVAAGVPYIDHTGTLSAFGNRSKSRVSELLTLFVTGRLRIFFATRHRSLKDAISDLNVEGIAQSIRDSRQALAELGESAPKIAVAALNPHGGEDGLFGREEIDVLRPAIALTRSKGIDVYGPIPADAVFVHAVQGRYDAVISLFHDQGHIAAKMHDFERTISITAGLDYIRSSVDHGTAFDIAGRGIANAVSMAESVRVGAEYIHRQREARGGS